MSYTPVDLHFLDVRGEDHVVHAVTTDGHGWHVKAAFGEETFTRHCSSWQGVERTVNWLRRHAHESPPSPGGIAGRFAAAIAFVFIALGAGVATAQPVTPDDAIATFTTATHDYALMHRRIEQQLGPMAVTAAPATILKGIEKMAAAIRVARPDARQGDVFAPAVAPLLRARIAIALAEHDLTAEDVRAAAVDEGNEFSAVPLRVNGTFPWVLGSAMFPCVIEALPPLPPELQYRIVGDDLLLIDVHASLIVDLLPFALAGTHDTNPSPAGLLP